MTNSEQLEYLRKRSILFLEFIISKSGKSALLDQFLDLVNNFYSSGNLKGLKELNKEFDRWSKELSKPEDSFEFYAILRQELGEGFESFQSKKLKIILKEGIHTLEDYDIVQDRINQIFQKPDTTKEMESLNALLRKYENS